MLPWASSQDDPEWAETFKPSKGCFLEMKGIADDGSDQGSFLIRCRSFESTSLAGIVLRGDYICSSDQYWSWWMSHGAGAKQAQNGKYHICRKEPSRCLERTAFMHTNKVREIPAKVIKQADKFASLWIHQGAAGKQLKKHLAGWSLPRPRSAHWGDDDEEDGQEDEDEDEDADSCDDADDRGARANGEEEEAPAPKAMKSSSIVQDLQKLRDEVEDDEGAPKKKRRKKGKARKTVFATVADHDGGEMEKPEPANRKRPLRDKESSASGGAHKAEKKRRILGQCSQRCF